MKKQLHLVAIVVALLMVNPVHAGIPVIDVGNLSQNIMSTIEAIAQTAKQIQQYQTQLKQYENMIKNTMKPDAYIWDQAQDTMQKLLAAQDTMNHYKHHAGNLEAHLNRYQDVNHYSNSPCFTAAGCSQGERAVMEQNRRLASEAQKKANDDLFRTLDHQQTALANDARTLERLQNNAQGAEGQMQAIGFANQIASNQSNQLLQIRAVLLAQQAAAATRNQAELDREAQYEASRDLLYRGLSTPVDRSISKGY